VASDTGVSVTDSEVAWIIAGASAVITTAAVIMRTAASRSRAVWRMVVIAGRGESWGGL
jgi:hypothetical protein